MDNLTKQEMRQRKYDRRGQEFEKSTKSADDKEARHAEATAPTPPPITDAEAAAELES